MLGKKKNPLGPITVTQRLSWGGLTLAFLETTTRESLPASTAEATCLHRARCALLQGTQTPQRKPRRYLKKRRRDLICPRSTLKTPQICSRAKTFCCSSHLALCVCPLFSWDWALVSRLDAELVEQVVRLSHVSLQTRAWRRKAQPETAVTRSNHGCYKLQIFWQSSEIRMQRRSKESITDSLRERLNYFYLNQLPTVPANGPSFGLL